MCSPKGCFISYYYSVFKMSVPFGAEQEGENSLKTLCFKNIPDIVLMFSKG